ncbi:MAG: hypothetical protein ACREQL_11370 [Candidatus Binatia bacterium]
MMMRTIAVVVGLTLGAGVAHGQDRIVLDEVVGSWLGDPEVQYVELRMLDPGQNALAGVGFLVFEDATGSTDGRRVFGFQVSVARGANGVKILVATTKARNQAGFEPDFILPVGFVRPTAGRICYGIVTNQGTALVDCVAYGKYTGPNAPFGQPTPITPDNRALRRNALTGKNRADWIGALDPMLENNAGTVGPLAETLCGDGAISQGEECDGTALAGATCASLGFVKGKLVCAQCHYDTSGCTSCGNDAITGDEECDGIDLGDRTCESIGFTGGTLACTEKCVLTTAGCDPTFFVPGGGPPKTDCLGEWRIMNAAGRPKGDGKALPRQRCTDGDTGCDADGLRNGTCEFTVAPCFSRADARLSKCSLASIDSWTLVGKVDPADPTIAALLASVAALGPSSVAGATVTFAPRLAEQDACGTPVTIAVSAKGRLALRARTLGSGLRDVDNLRLVCAP